MTHIIKVQETGRGLEMAVHEKYAERVHDFDARLGSLSPAFKRELAKGRVYPTVISVNNEIPKIKKHAQTKDQVLQYDVNLSG